MSILESQWRTLSKKSVEDVREAVAEAMVKFHGSVNATKAMNSAGDMERIVHIGTDAQKHGKKTDFVTAVVILNPGHGGVAFYAKERMEHVNSLQYKLFTEVGFSLEIALALCESGVNPEAIDVHVDANTNLKWESGPFHQRLAGMVVAHGFNAVLKPDAWCASHVADHAVKHKNESNMRKRRQLKCRNKTNSRKTRK
jgi:predicted RNase H-related nuclease YkuK (DUF458 family)